MFSNCPHCLRTIRLKADGTFAYHIHSTWDKEACPGFKQASTWKETLSIIAHGRDPRGKCMACGGMVSDEPAECSQCNIEVYRDDQRRKADFDRRKAKR